MKKKKTVICAILAVLLLVLMGLLLVPFSRFYMGHNLRVRLRVKVNGENVVPYNITCLNDSDESQKLKVRSLDDYTDVSCAANLYGGYVFSYDVDTPDGVRHFTFMIMKTHNWGPRYSCSYEMNLNESEDDWLARVLLVERNALGEIQEIKLSEDENAHVQLGP